MGSGWVGRQKKLIDVWLVYTHNPEKKRFYRSVQAAEPGKPGDIAAVYISRLEGDAASLAFLDVRFSL
jgi:hypothetical protein